MCEPTSSSVDSTQTSLSTGQQFMMKEYEQVCKDNSERLKELWALEKFALGGAAAIAAWLFVTPTSSQLPRSSWWLPFLFLLLCGVRFGSGMIHLDRRSAEYIKKIEKHFLGKEGGYETWFRPLPPNETWAYWIVWGIALGTSFVLALLKS